MFSILELDVAQSTHFSSLHAFCQREPCQCLSAHRPVVAAFDHSSTPVSSPVVMSNHSAAISASHSQHRRSGRKAMTTGGMPNARGSNADPAAAHPIILSVLYSSEEISEAVKQLGRQLAEEYADKQPLLLGALTGAFMFTADLARAMHPVPSGMAVDFFSTSSYGAATVSSGEVQLQMGGKIGVSGRHVLVVEDIIDTGATLQRVVRRLQEAEVASVKVVVLLDKTARRKVDIQPDYCAFHCPDEFIVGYGLDFNEHYRSLPYIGVLRPECYP